MKPAWTQPQNVLNLAIIFVLATWIGHPETFPGRTLRQWIQSVQFRSYLRSNLELLQDGTAIFGDPGASEAIVVFSDFFCPYCRRGALELQDLVAGYHDVKVVIRFYPTTRTHPLAETAASAAFCASRAGAFPEIHDFLFGDTTWIRTRNWLKIGKGAGIENADEFVDCVGSIEAHEAIMSDRLMAVRAGVSVLPTYIIRGRKYQGVLSLDDLLHALGKDG